MMNDQTTTTTVNTTATPPTGAAATSSPTPATKTKAPTKSTPNKNAKSSTSVSHSWDVHGPLVRQAFQAIQIMLATPDPTPSEATTPISPDAIASLYTNLSTILLNAYQGGVFKQLQTELPKLFIATNATHRILAELLIRLTPRLPVQRSQIFPVVPLPIPSTITNSWLSQLIFKSSFELIGSSTSHGLQILLLNCVKDVNPPITSEDQAYIRTNLLPIWITTPTIFQSLLTTFSFASQLTPDDHWYYFNSLMNVGSPLHASSGAMYLLHFNLLALANPEAILKPMLQPNGGNSHLSHMAETEALEIGRLCPSFRPPLINMLTTIAHKSTISMKLIEKYGLNPGDFPIVQSDVRYKQIKWLVRSGKGEELGAEVCGYDQDLQRTLIKCLVKAQELDSAKKMLTEFHLEHDEKLQTRISELEAAFAKNPPRAPTSNQPPTDYLQLPPNIPVVFVTGSDPSSLASAAHGLSSSQTYIVGLDVEFGFTGSLSNQPALLQISTRQTVFLFDLLTFDTTPQMGIILSALFSDPKILKVGYAWKVWNATLMFACLILRGRLDFVCKQIPPPQHMIGDWSILRSGFPQAACFQFQTNVLDMADPAKVMDREERIRRQEQDKEQARLEKEKLGMTTAPPVHLTGLGVPPQQIAEPIPADSKEIENDANIDDEDEDCADDPLNVSATSSTTATSTTTTSSPEQARLERRRAKKVSKRAARNSLKGSPTPDAATSTTSANNDVDDGFPKGVAKGLSSLSELCLGRPLDKTFQISAWRRRPLKPAQIHYAALDAYCLIGIFDAFFTQPLPIIQAMKLPPLETFIQIQQPKETTVDT